jgi:hypothetical protein
MSSFDIDKLTLECFVNRNTYHKYLAKKDPNSFQENKLWNEQLLEQHDALLSIISQFIQNPDTIQDETTRDIFNRFIVECMDILTKQKQAYDDLNKTDETDIFVKKTDETDEMMFSQCEELRIEPTNPIEYWKMQKVLRQNYTKLP